MPGGGSRGGGAVLVTLLAITAVLAAPGAAAALDLGQWVPGLKLTPFVSQRFEYESNVFQVPSGSRDDLILKTVPGFLVDWTAGKHALSVGYRAEILRFLDLEEQDAEHHVVVGQLHLEFARLLLNLRDDFAITTEPPTSELTGRIESTTNVLAPEVEYRLSPRLSTGLNYSWTHVDFHERDLDVLDRDEHLVGVSVFWKFLPKTDLRLNYNYGVKEFDSASDRDVTRHVMLLGLRGDLTAKLSSTFRAGWEVREGDSSRGDFQGYVVGGDWVFRPTERTTLTLITDRSVQESSFGTNAFFVATSGTISVEHRFTPKLEASLRFTLGENAYPDKETLNGVTKRRNDLLLGWGTGVEYEIQKWLRLGAEYSHVRRDSNFGQFDFTDDKVTAFITLQF